MPEDNKVTEGGRAEIANWVAAGLVITGMLYGVAINDAQIVVMLASAGIGYLFGKASKSNGK